MRFHHQLFISLICIYINIVSCSLIVTAEDEDETYIVSDWGDLTPLNAINSNVVEFIWTVKNFSLLVEEDPEIVFSPKFYVTRPGHRLQLMLIPNTTYSDYTQYTGIFFRLVTGKYDSEINWPYELKTVLTLINQDKVNDTKDKDIHFTVVPNTDPCRLRSAFLRPSTDNDNSMRPDGCGNRRHAALEFLQNNREKYLQNDTLLIKVTIYLNDFGQTHTKAIMGMRYNQLVSNYEWVIKDYPNVQKEALEKENVVVLSSEPFYTHTKGYLMQIFMTLLPKKKAFAISIALSQGDHDRYLQWPFPYTFEVAIVDQSPGYWKRDYSVSMQPSTSECGTTPFFQPGGYPDFCFITVQSMELLSLTHYNFMVNGTLRIRFTTKFEKYAGRKQASLIIENKRLIAEYNWLIPAIEGKIEKYDYVKGKPKILSSEEFYTNGQGYLMQLILTLNHSEDSNEGILGLEMAIIEGEYDGVLRWPFNKSFELSIVKQRYDDNIFGGVDAVNNSNAETVNSSTYNGDVVQLIVPSSTNCSHHSFQRPIERNPPCGEKNFITFDRISRSRDFIKLGNLQVKARIHLNDIIL